MCNSPIVCKRLSAPGFLLLQFKKDVKSNDIWGHTLTGMDDSKCSAIKSGQSNGFSQKT